MRIKHFGYWSPNDVNNQKPIEKGVLVAWDFKPWRVVDFHKDEEPRDSNEPGYDYWVIILRPDGIDMDQTAHSKDLHLRGPVPNYQKRNPLGNHFDRLHEHYGLCVHCNELLPCRDRMAERAAERVSQNASRYETPGVCPHCLEPVTHRQDRETFPNVYVPLGPDVTFHAGRKACRRAMNDYRDKVGQPEAQLRIDGGGGV